jgi:endonuclease-8
MPEGDTIFKAARAMHRALAGGTVTRFESVYPALTRVADDDPIIGRTIVDVSARGKHLLITFSDDRTLRTHMRMHGSWHLYQPGVRWRRPASEMRVLVATATVVAVGFNVPEAEFLTPRDLARHRQLRRLGPDLLAPTFDAANAQLRMREHHDKPIADVLLRQQVVAGIGNEFKSEILFLAGIDPFRMVSTLSDADLQTIIRISREQLKANVLPRIRTLSMAVGRRTTRSLDPAAKLWVYARGGKPCRRCGAIIQARKTGEDARITYWCPACQT